MGVFALRRPTNTPFAGAQGVPPDNERAKLLGGVYKIALIRGRCTRELITDWWFASTTEPIGSFCLGKTMSAPMEKVVVRRGGRRWFQFGIGSLLLLMLLCGVLFAFVAQYRREAEREKRVIATVEEIGGKCAAAPRGPAWLQWLAGNRASSRVVAVDLSRRVVAIGMTPGLCH
jgi:hypothetical protein